MKYLILAPFLVLTSSAFAANKIECSQLSGWETGGYDVYMTFSSDLNKKSSTVTELKALNLKYNIEGDSIDDENNWGGTSYSQESVLNNVDYNPRKYKNHYKYEMNIDTPQSFGHVDLIIPKNELNAPTGEMFNSYAIMTSIEDHFGGTVKLECRVAVKKETIFSQTINTIDNLLIPAPDAEGMLSYRLPKIENYENDLSKIITDLMINSMFSGISNLNLNELNTYHSEVNNSVDKVMKELNFGYSPLFCEKLVKNFWHNSDRVSLNKCKEKTKKIVTSMLKDKDIDHVSIVSASGNEYGSWESVYLIGRNFDTEESIIIFFDIIHEI